MLSFSSWVWRPSRLHQVRAVACLPPSPRHGPPDAAPSQPRAGPAASHGTSALAARAVLRCAVAPLAGSLAGVKAAAFSLSLLSTPLVRSAPCVAAGFHAVVTVRSSFSVLFFSL